MAPVHAQVLGQPAGHDHAHAVVHPARVPELAHAGIDDRHAGAALAPGIEPCLQRPRPAEIGEARVQRLVGHLREVVQDVVGELAPAQFGEETVAVFGGDGIAGIEHRRGHALHRDLAEVQVRRQPRGARLGGHVACRGVTGQRLAEEPRQRVAGAGLARGEALPEAGVPWRRRRGQQGVERDPVRRFGCVRRGQPRRRVPQPRRAPLRPRRFPERREHAVRIALLRRHLPGLEQQRAVETLRMQAGFAQGALDLRVALLDRRLVAARPQHRLGAGEGGQRLQGAQARPAQHQQARTAALQRVGQRRQRAPAPGIGGRARCPVALFFRRVDVDGHRQPAAFERGAQRGLVVQAQVVAEPDQGDGHAISYTVPRFLPCHGRYQARIAAMSAGRSPVVWNSGPMPMVLSG